MSDSPILYVAGQRTFNVGQNLLINGNFSVNQRGGTKTPGIGVYGFDRWKGHLDGLEQIVEYVGVETNVVLTWEGGGTATINGAGGTTSPVTVFVPADTNISVVVPATSDMVQLEFGTEPTTYDYRDPGTELAMCQRYYYLDPAQRLSADRGTGVYCWNWDFPSTMRAVPTCSVSATAGAAPTIFGAATTGVGCFNTHTNALQYFDLVADAEL